MKRSDVYSLILIAGIGTLAAFILCNSLLGDPKNAKVDFKALRKVLTSDLAQPNEEIFNSTVINPTIEVYVGDCEDIDQNGMLDKAELIACGKVAPDAADQNTGEDGDNARGD